MSTEVIVLSSSPLPVREQSNIAPRSPRPVVVRSTSSPGSLDEPRRSPRFVPSRHFAPEAQTKPGSPLRKRLSRCLPTAITPTEYRESTDASAQAEVVTSVNSLPTEAPTDKQDEPAVKKRGRGKPPIQNKVSANALGQAVQAGPAPSGKWRANKRGLRREPEDDGEFFLDRSHELYMMHFQPDLIYEAVLKPLEQGEDLTAQKVDYSFIEDELTVDIALELYRMEREHEEGGEGDKTKRRSPHFGNARSVKASKILAKPKARGRAAKTRTEPKVKVMKSKKKPEAKKSVAKPKATKKSIKTAKNPSEETGQAGSATNMQTVDPVLVVDAEEKTMACKRKRDWTPPHDSFIDIATLEKADDMDGTITRVPLRDVVRSITHEDAQAVPPVDILVPAPKPRGRPPGKAKAERAKKSNVEGDSVEKVKKTPAKPAQPKRPKTITGMALEAYQPAEETPQPDNGISHFFKQVAKEAKKARSRSPTKKPSLKKDASTDGHVDISVIAEGPKAKARKTVKIAKDADIIRPKLLSPTSAARKMSQQDFVFGTSSQLGCEENLEERLDLQRALRASMMNAIEINDSDSQLSMRVRKGVWDAAGDQEVDRSLLEDLEQDRVRALSPVQTVVAISIKEHGIEDTENLVKALPKAIASPGPDQAIYHELSDDEITPAGTPEQALEAAFVNISDVSSPTAFQEPASPISIRSSPEVPLRQTHTLLSLPSPAKALPSLSRSRPRLASLSPIRQRPVLRDLSTNTSPRKDRTISLGKTILCDFDDIDLLPPMIDVRAIVEGTHTDTVTPVKRPRGRPRKTPLAVLADEPLIDTPASLDDEPATSTKKSKNTKSPSRKSPTTKKNSWTNIEDIEDSEPDATPSPPRGSQTRRLPDITGMKIPALSRANTAPSTTSPAKEAESSKPKRALSPRATKAKAYSQAKKETDAGWASTASLLYPQITNLIKTNREQADPTGKYIFNGRRTATKPSTTSASQSALLPSTQTETRLASTAPRLKLSWYEKMLMYDPIVIEDLTDFLVAKGVVVPLTAEQEAQQLEFGRQGIKVKGSRGLEPWMVRAWCEAHGICCLWRASLLGGSRARY